MVFLGYYFPAGSMVVGLLACLMVRLFITLDAPGPKRWLLDGIVTGLALLATAVWIAEQQVDLFAALGTGGTRRGDGLKIRFRNDRAFARARQRADRLCRRDLFKELADRARTAPFEGGAAVTRGGD